MAKKRNSRGWLERFLDPEPESPPVQEEPKQPTLQPALRQIGVTDCPICEHEVAVLLTRTNRPFINCSYCSARLFYNGRVAMRLLRKRMTPLEEE